MIRRRTLHSIGLFGFVLLAIEFLDELAFGAREAAWPLIRGDLRLDYAQIGLLLGIPAVVSGIVEPFLGILGDVWRRRVLVLGGGLVFAAALLLTALSRQYLVLLLSFILFYPASGAFVSLSQATLMDLAPARHEQNMARWTFAGSLGVLAGTLALSGASAIGVGWRPLFFLFAGISLALVVAAWRFPFPKARPDGDESPGFVNGLAGALAALRRGEVLRWLALLQFSDLMLDVLLGFLALYFADVVRVGAGEAALAVTVWTAASLLGDFLVIPLLERVRGLSYLRVSAALELVLFVAFLIAPAVWAKFLLLALLGLFSAGWYAVLQAQLYTSMPGRSGTVMSLNNIFGLVGGLMPLALGLVASRVGLPVAMWLLLLGPVALLAGIPRRSDS